MKAESCQIFKKIKIPNFMKTHPMGSELFQADGRTIWNHDAFRNFVNAPRNCCTSGPNLAKVIGFVLILKPMKCQFQSDATDFNVDGHVGQCQSVFHPELLKLWHSYILKKYAPVNILQMFKETPPLQALKQANTSLYIQTGIHWHLLINHSGTACIHIFSFTFTQISSFLEQFQIHACYIYMCWDSSQYSHLPQARLSRNRILVGT